MTQTDSNIAYKMVFALRQCLADNQRAAVWPEWLKGMSETEFRSAFHTRFPRRRKYDEKAFRKCAPETYGQIWARWEAIIHDRSSAYRRCMKALERALHVLAPKCELSTRTDKMNVLYVVSSSTYRSQGFGAIRYAEAAAQREAELLHRAGFEVWVAQVNVQSGCDVYGYRWDSADFEVRANAHPWQYDALLRSTQYDPAAFAQWCWAHGVNPRVYDPFLPYGEVYEPS